MTMPTSATPETSRRQVKTGHVISNKMQKTIVVAVETQKQHRIYKKNYRWTKHFKAHDETNSARIGDVVTIEETRPISKDKHWKLIDIVRRADQAPTVAEIATADVQPPTPTGVKS